MERTTTRVTIPRRWQRPLAAAAMALGLAASGAAHAATPCEAPPPTRIVVQPIYPRPTIDVSLDLAGLKREAGAADSAHGEFTEPLGLTSATMKGSFEDDVAFIVDAPGGRTPLCGYATEIRVQFGFQDVVIHIAREVGTYPCLYDEVLQHELRHVQVDQDMVALYAPRLETRLRALAARIGAVRAGSADAIHATIRQAIEVAVTQDLEAFNLATRARQRRVDLTAEYRRMGDVCDGAAGKLLSGQRR